MAMAAATRDVFVKTTPERSWMRRRRAHTDPLNIRCRSIFPRNNNGPIRRNRTVIDEKTDRRSKRRRRKNINTARGGASRLMMVDDEIAVINGMESKSLS